MPKEQFLKTGFIQRLDKYLLTHWPVTWSTRIHSVFYFGVLFSLLLAGICFMVPDDPRNQNEIYSWVILLSVVSLLAFVFWLIFLLRFNVFKRYGKWGRFDSVKTFLIYFLIILLFVSWPFMPAIVQSVRADMKYGSAELIKDINDLNVKICQLERDSIDIRFNADTLQLSEKIRGEERRTVLNEGEEHVDYSERYYLLDPARLKMRLLSADSSRKLNDSVYIVYECPEYRFVNPYNLQYNSQGAVYTSMQLYNLALRTKPLIDRNAARDQVAAIIKKYRSGTKVSRYSSYYDIVPAYDNDADIRTRIIARFNLYDVSDSVTNIAEKKYRWSPAFLPVAIRIAYYLTLSLSLLVFIYRHSTRKTFFLSLLAAVIITILTTLFLAVSGGGVYFLNWYLGYFVLFCILAGLIFYKTNRDAVSGISLNLAVFMTPLVPLLSTALYYFYLHRKYDFRTTDNIQNRYDESVFADEKLHFVLSEAGGFLLLLILAGTVIHRLYRKWYALPEQ